MSIEYDVLKRSHVVFDQLEAFGFVKDHGYSYSENIIDDLRIVIHIDDKGVLTGKVYDEFDEEYTNYRVVGVQGEYACHVRDQYIDVLNKIKEACYEEDYFVFSQANRIAEIVNEKYHNLPEFTFEEDDIAVFRNSNNNKWYGIIMRIDYSKIDATKSGEIEVLNVKMDTSKIESLMETPGYFKCYHMNKKYWITMILDDTLSDEEIINNIIDSYNLIDTAKAGKEWIVPANPKYYDVVGAFTNHKTVMWKQSTNIKEGDIVYMYVAQPYSSILYKCKVLEAHIPYNYNSEIHIKEMMNLELLESYEPGKYSFALLNTFDVKAVRGPRRMPEKLIKYIANS